ncbi:MAG: hypothetical protein CMP14_12155 [Rickettsiales bacterium]|nr:hypothetical protein [Rickettsiales bacterium]
MRLKKSELRRIIRESIKQEMGMHLDEAGKLKAIMGLISMFAGDKAKEDDDLLVEPDSEDELEEALAGFAPGGGPKRSHPAQDPDTFADHPDYRAGSKDASEGITPPEDASEEYRAGYDSAMQEW